MSEAKEQTMPYQSVQDVPERELMCLGDLQRFNGTPALVLCEACHLGLLGFNSDPDSETQPGQECARCGAVRPTELRGGLQDATDGLVAARLAGATDADVAKVLRDVRYYVANERWKRGEGPPPSVALGL